MAQLGLESVSFTEKFSSLWLCASVEGVEVHFLKPQTYMNVSGQAYLKWKEKFQGESRVLVVFDDMDLPVGKIRYRGVGSDGGHRGLRSIIESAQTESVPRLRLGIGRPTSTDTVDFVLEKFGPEERPIVDKVLKGASEQIKIWIASPSDEESMNILNGAKFRYVS